MNDQPNGHRPAEQPVRPPDADRFKFDDSPEDAQPPGDGTFDIIDDEVDEPGDPDDRTRAEAEAARGSIVNRMPRIPRRRPRSLLVLLLILGLTVTMGIYAMSWSYRLRVSDEKGELRRLEERDVMSTWQATYSRLKYGPNSKILPPYVVYAPLTPVEKAKAEALKQQVGTQFKPDEDQAKFIEDTKQMRADNEGPTTGPTTNPAS